MLGGGEQPFKEHREVLLNGIKELYLSKALCDVRIICQGGEEVFAHKLVLFSCSGFFESYIRTSQDYVLKYVDLNQMSVLDLGQFSAEDMRTILDWIYTGDPPRDEVLAKKIFNITMISNFLLIDVVKVQCLRFFEKLNVTESPMNPEYPMDLYNLGSLLGDSKILALSLDGFLMMRTLPRDFYKIDVETMKTFLRCFDQCSLYVIWRTNALTRELFLLRLVASYIKFDKEQRLKDATDLFMLLRLMLIVDHLNFKALNLEELENPEAFPDLYRALVSCLVPDAHPLSSFENLWLPRKESIKYSVLTWNRCTALQNGSKLQELADDLGNIFNPGFAGKFISEEMAEEPSLLHVTKKFSLENEGAYIIGIDVFTNTSGLKLGLVDGIRLRWSDGTSQQAGSASGHCHSVSFQPPRTAAITVWLAAPSRVVLTAVLITTWTAEGPGRRAVRSHGPFGRLEGATMREPLLTNKQFASKPYLDGIYGCELDVRGQTLLCDLSFKTSFFVNLPLNCLLDHHSPSGQKFDEPTLEYLRQTHHVIKVYKFREVARAATPKWHSFFCGPPVANANSRCIYCASLILD